jgi:hypothetical protein
VKEMYSRNGTLKYIYSRKPKTKKSVAGWGGFRFFAGEWESGVSEV